MNRGSKYLFNGCYCLVGAYLVFGCLLIFVRFVSQYRIAYSVKRVVDWIVDSTLSVSVDQICSVYTVYSSYCVTVMSSYNMSVVAVLIVIVIVLMLW